MIGKSSAPNFWMKGEKRGPDLQEGEKALYLLLSSVRFRNTLLNLDNIKEEGRKKFREYLVTEADNPLIRIVRELGLWSRNVGPFYLSLIAICYWLYKIKMNLKKSFRELMTDWGFDDDTTLLIFELGKKKKEVHYFSRISNFILRWFEGYFEMEKELPPLLTFLESLTRVTSKKINPEFVVEIREKLVFHLLKYHEINGELLSRLVNLKVEDSLSSKKVYGIVSASDFFAELD
ncbi:MAG: hypothetical protein QXX95_06995 [Nitrososphaerales archaeon]